MNVLVTGAAGLIGMALRPALEEHGHKVIAIDITDFNRSDPALRKISLDDRSALEALIRDEAVDSIVHCGAISGPMMAKGDPLKLVSVNIDATALLLDLARIYAMKRFVFCSSISVYGNVGTANITELTPLRPTSVYGATKVACEQLVQGFAEEYGVSGVSLRISRVYGPYRRANCHINSLIRDAESGEMTVLPCDPTFIYHYVYVDDVADAMMTALEVPSLPQRQYNVGSGEALTLPAVAAAAALANNKIRFRIVDGVDDVPDVQTSFDLSLIANDLEWKPKFRIGEGVTAYRNAILAGRSA